ncbi:MAG: Uma2 family endonuclease [Armatimonadota bacterium]|nr:Uma2 family endonuclease [Armatimonadota bacterium]
MTIPLLSQKPHLELVQREEETGFAAPFEYYYDNHVTREDLMGESEPQDRLLRYLMDVLEWLYRSEGWYIARNLNLYRVRQRREKPIAPDVAVFKGVVLTHEPEEYIRSWTVETPDDIAPSVVFEIASDKTWRQDVRLKPPIYAAMGVPEYFFYDSRPTRKRGVGHRPGAVRLRGWFAQHGEAVAMTPDERGWLWSDELDSWLAPDGPLLRLYDRDGALRLTGQVAERAAKEQAWAKLRAAGIDPGD